MALLIPNSMHCCKSSSCLSSFESIESKESLVSWHPLIWCNAGANDIGMVVGFDEVDADGNALAGNCGFLGGIGGPITVASLG